MASPRPPYKSIEGQNLGLGAGGELASRHVGLTPKRMTQPCVDATITLAAPVSTARQIAIQLRDAYGKDIDYVETVECILYLNVERTAFAATGGSTGLAIGSGGDGALLAVLAKKVFLLTSEADGDIDLVWTDNASEVAFIGLRLPNGNIVMSAALTI